MLWFQNLGFLQSFLIMFFSNFGLRIILGIIFTTFIFINLIFTRKVFLNFISIRDQDNVESLFNTEENSFLNWLNKKRITYTYLFGSIILGFLFSSISQNIWKIVLKYFNQTPFNETDPLFGKDIGFYVFSLPFFNFLKEMGMVLVILTLIVVGLIYILASGINSLKDMGVKLSTRAKSHMTLLIIGFLFLKAWDYRLSMFDLLYSSRGVAFGASYTDVNANLIGLKILFVIAIAIGVLLLASLFRRNYKIILYGIGIWLIASFVLGNLYPAFVQNFRVEPNEIAMEREYINYNIDNTLKAYGLGDMTTKDFQVKNNLNKNTLDKRKETINNIRLWDSRPLQSTYDQLQELRQYYDFINIDVDRYKIDGEYRQVMLAAREMNQSKLSGQAQTWINQTLKYTHGFGVAMSPVSRVTEQGLPEFYIKDIPPKNNTDLELNNSSIYYGEKTDRYVIANTDSREFHYPKGSKNVYTTYDGHGGVQMGNFLRKGIYAIRYGSLKFLLNTDINEDSRIMYYRNIKERVRRVAPFLKFDDNPYLVIHKGRLFWIQDAYTTTNRYPYSQPTNNMGNYIRNSIKIVIDAYNGDMDLYVMDDNDPLAQTYKKIFPDLFVDGDKMPENIRKHIRYPEDLFQIQANLYSVYHMQDPTVFYNKEDLWNIPQENFAGNTIEVQPYYIISQLPEEDEPEFILMQPFTPATKNNMIAWMAARSDGEHYGELFTYKFPKDKLVYGPNQIESRIDQDSEISQLLTLWSQRGSRVIRGNLLVIPINNSILYIEPVYLQAETSELPELKRVIVSYKNNIVMKNTLGNAIKAIFGETPEGTQEREEETNLADQLGLPSTINNLTQEAVDIYNQAIESQKEGNWSEYGSLLDQLQQILNKLNEVSNETTDGTTPETQ